jgi:hypothetical protein
MSIKTDVRVMLEAEHGIVGTAVGVQGAAQCVPEDSICCMSCGWMSCSRYSAHLSDLMETYIGVIT